ncbi:hypothetical protein SNOG_14101 [Parastagonospora nodorum SN15]|uniref:Uncharacterized protein n=1 Tax=Phaeosphaeria nodorum (strain SN15 / ATCC MYA-4574 / FGSC 10173) TaxID=321614 RepID=Q0U1T7_PHANO|nr:hypothetical protein SNOG_14101 [Parastagonospora nodorum SN15]EAT78338.1 hypothetical protein SNOG_14101 [Parastagonospora nodorum SN15]
MYGPSLGQRCRQCDADVDNDIRDYQTSTNRSIVRFAVRTLNESNDPFDEKWLSKNESRLAQTGKYSFTNGSLIVHQADQQERVGSLLLFACAPFGTQPSVGLRVNAQISVNLGKRPQQVLNDSETVEMIATSFIGCDPDVHNVRQRAPSNTNVNNRKDEIRDTGRTLRK